MARRMIVATGRSATRRGMRHLTRLGFSTMRIPAREVLAEYGRCLDRGIVEQCRALRPLHHDAARRGPPPRSGRGFADEHMLLALLLAAATPAAAQHAEHAQEPDRAAVMATVDRLFGALRARTRAALLARGRGRRAGHVARVDEQGRPEVHSTDWTTFADRLARITDAAARADDRSARSQSKATSR